MSDLIQPIVDGKVVKNTTETESSRNVGNDSLGKDAFLNLLICQMQNQDPLNPNTDSEYIAQLATFSQVEELQNVGKNVENMQAMSYIGKYVELETEKSDGSKTTVNGVVSSVRLSNENVYLTIGENEYLANTVTNVYAEVPVMKDDSLVE